MPYVITLEHIPAGYVAKSSKKGETSVPVIPMGYTTSEEGEIFFKFMDGFSSTIISKLPSHLNIKESSIDNMLVIIKPDKKAIVYVNELNFVLKMMSKRNVKAGEAIFIDDIADIKSLHIDNVEIPNNAGIYFVFSKGWRKCFFFDLWPIQMVGTKNRNYDIDILFGQLYAYLHYQDLFKVSDEEWDRLFEDQWFLFATLNTNTKKQMIAHLREGWCIDDLMETIIEDLKEKLDSLIDKCRKNKYITPHIEFIEKAKEEFLEEDYISATSILYPRIEGIMREFHKEKDKKSKATQTTLVNTLIHRSDISKNDLSLLLPGRFEKYLKDVYFADFGPDTTPTLSRHSTAHGVAPKEAYSLKGTAIGFFILDQLSYYLRDE